MRYEKNLPKNNMTIESTSCCGLKEIESITGESPEELLKGVCEYLNAEVWEFDFSLLLFTATTDMDEGDNLAKYIKKGGLGTVVKTRPKKNPNTGNRIVAWVWSVNERALRAWCRKNQPHLYTISYGDY